MKRLMMLFGLLGMAMLPMFGQDLPSVPGNFLEIAGRLPELLGSFGGVYVLAVGLMPLLLGVLKMVEAKKALKYGLTVIVCLALTVLARFVPFGFLYTATLIGVAGHFLALLIAQILTYAAIKPFLDAAAEKFNFWK